MTISPAANRLLPRWAYVTGETDEANTDDETLAQLTLLVPSRFQGFVPARHPARRYEMSLNDRGYFRESQEILEAVWAAAPQGGRERILLRACIQIANANLRLRMKKPHAAARLLGEALGELAAQRRWRRFCGGLSGGGYGGPDPGRTAAAAARQSRLGSFFSDQRNMK
jgi:hypothetical protein